MINTHTSTNFPAAPPMRRWWLSLYHRLSAGGKRNLLALCLSAALLVNGELQIMQQAGPANSLPPRAPVGNQFQVNSYTDGRQLRQVTAMDSDGDFVVIWTSDGSNYGDTDGFSIQGQRYNSAGIAQGSQFQVNTYTTSYQYASAVAMDSDGDFVVVWFSYGSSGDTDSFSIQGRRYNSAGIPQGDQFQVNSYTTGAQHSSAVAMDSDGDFVVVWSGYGVTHGGDESENIMGQRYNSVGTAQGNSFWVNSYTTGLQNAPHIALDNDGDFVVVWVSHNSNGSDPNDSIQGQRFNNSGTRRGSQFQVNSYTTDLQWSPAVALDSDGDFVIIWSSYGSDTKDTSLSSIQGQRYNSVGTRQGSQFLVNSYSTGRQYEPAIALDSDGDFVVIWASDGSYGSDNSSYSIQGQHYNSAGAAQGSQFQVNSYTSDQQGYPAIALDSDGDFVISWTSEGSYGKDTSSYSIQSQRFASENPNPTPTPPSPPPRQSIYLPAVIRD